MQRSLCLIAVAILCCGCPGQVADPAMKSGPVPSVIVLVTVDGARARELSAFGGSRETPALRDLVANGTAWTDAWTTTPMTRPAVATYLTGLAPDRHGVTDDLFGELPDTVPTLATVLGAAGYRTAAFPDSDFLGPASGLLRGFEVTGDTPPIPVQPWRWLPFIRPADDLVSDFDAWLETLPAGTRYFAWLHFTQPLLDEVGSVVRPLAAKRGKGKATGPEHEGIERVDAALGKILGSIRARGEFEDALIVFAATIGDPMGGGDEAPGPGMSLAPAAIEVPVVVKFPGGGRAPRGESEPVWAPDVPATIAASAGVALDPAAEGTSLGESAPADRVRIAWTWAPRDQFGLAPARAGRLGETTIVEGPGVASPPVPADAAQAERVQAALAGRTWPPPSEIPRDEARRFLASHGITIAADPPGPRTMPAAERRKVAEELLLARFTLKAGYRHVMKDAFRNVFEMAPDLPGVRLDFGQFSVLSLKGHDEAVDVLRRGVELYPENPEMWHWYAHAIWKDTETAEAFLREILPYREQDADVLYDIACTRSLSGDLNASADFLRRAIEAGFTTWGLMETDSDLRALRESGQFAEVLQEYRR